VRVPDAIGHDGVHLRRLSQLVSGKGEPQQGRFDT
jgi:hypothetical protein